MARSNNENQIYIGARFYFALYKKITLVGGVGYYDDRNKQMRERESKSGLNDRSDSGNAVSNDEPG